MLLIIRSITKVCTGKIEKKSTIIIILLCYKNVILLYCNLHPNFRGVNVKNVHFRISEIHCVLMYTCVYYGHINKYIYLFIHTHLDVEGQTLYGRLQILYTECRKCVFSGSLELEYEISSDIFKPLIN